MRKAPLRRSSIAGSTSWLGILSGLTLQPAVKPLEGIGLHLAIELVRTRVELSLVTFADAGPMVHIGQDQIGAPHFGDGKELIFKIIENHHGMRKIEP